jgi:DNA polymerase
VIVLPEKLSLTALRDAAAGCRACPLWENATQAVFGEGRAKHFKWQPRGKRRTHQKPSWSELAACRPWLDAELEVVAPRALVLLGATAAQSLLGRQFRVARRRGELLESELAEIVVATVHPSSILRAQDGDREREFAALVDDLRVVASALRR